MAYNSEDLLLKDYQATLDSLAEGADSDVWMEAMLLLVNRTLDLLRERTTEVERFGANELLERFASEDIEVFCDMTVAMIHGNIDDQGMSHDEPQRNTTMLTLHFPDNEDAHMIQLEDNLSLLEMAAKFRIDPDMKVWQVDASPG